MHSNANSKHSNVIQSFRMQIRTIQKGFEAFETIFEPFQRNSNHSNANLNHSKGIRSIPLKFESFERDLKLSNPISNLSKGIRGIQMQILTIRK